MLSAFSFLYVPFWDRNLGSEQKSLFFATGIDHHHHDYHHHPRFRKRVCHMPVHIPFENHGRCSVALITLKKHPKRLYHYSKASGQQESWALRDYVTQEILRSGESEMTASEIENLVDNFAEKPAYRSVKLVARWKADCRASSQLR